MTSDSDRDRKIIVTSGRLGPRQVAVVLAAFAIIGPAVMFGSGDTRYFIAIGVIVLLITFLSFSRQWIVEADTGTKRLRIFRELFGRWRKTIVDCSFDDCEALGVLEYSSDGFFGYCVYVQLKGGKRHTIQVAGQSQKEALRIADELSNAIETWRRDISV